MRNTSEQNLTDSQLAEYQKSWEWISLQTATCILAIIQAFILFNLLFAERISVTKRRNELCIPVQGSHCRARRCSTASRDNRPIWLKRLTIMASASALFKLFTNEIDLFFGRESDVSCQVLGYTAVVGYGSSLFFIYVILWLRQAQLQSMKALLQLPGKKVRLFCSKLLLAVMILTFLVLFVLNFVTMTLHASPQGCVFSDTGQVSQSARSSAGLIFTTVFQPAFAALLLYPLLKSKSDQAKADTSSTSVKKNVDRTYRLIKRTLVTVLIVAATDVATIVASFTMESLPAIKLAVVYDLNAFIGVASILFSFADWRKRFRFRSYRRRDSNIVQQTSI